MRVVRLGRRAMATVFELTLVGDDEGSLRAVGESALDEIERVEEQISLFLPGSEIAHLNGAAAGVDRPISRQLAHLLGRAEAIRIETGGAFDVTVGALMRSRGFHAGAPGEPAATPLPEAGARLRLGEETLARLADSVTLDLGAIGKGWAIDRAVARLVAGRVSSAFLHGGWSSMYALGAPPDTYGWKVGLVDPAEPEVRIGTLALRDRALSVSGADGRRAGLDAASHVVDPRTGEAPPRATAWALSRDATRADALSTAFLLLPTPSVRDLCERGDDGALLLAPDRLEIGLEMDRFREPRGAADLSRRRFLGATAAAAAAFSIGLPDPAPALQRSAGRVRVGVVGLGRQGSLLLSQLRRIPGVQVAAICDVLPGALDEALELTGRNVESYVDHRHMLDVERLDGVVVATPTFDHAPIVLDALAEGTGVFCEAPMAGTIEDCRRIVEAAEGSSAVFQVGHQRRWSRLYPHAVRHYEGGSIGQLLRLRAQWNRRSTWRQPSVRGPAEDRRVNWRLFRETSGGLVLEEGSHLFDLAGWLTGGTPEAVSGFGSLLEWTDHRTVNDTVQVMLAYPGGLQVAFDATLGSSYGEEQEALFGTAGTMVLLRQSKGLLFKEPDSVAAGWEVFARKELLDNRRGILLDPEATRYVTESTELSGVAGERPDFLAELAAFVDSVRTGGLPRCGARDGLRSCVTALVALEAIESGTNRTFTPESFAV